MAEDKERSIRINYEYDETMHLVEKITQKVTETTDEFIFETISDWWMHKMQQRILKKADLERALVNYMCKTEPEVEGGGSTWWYVCGECHGAIDKGDAYCRHCGRRQRWDK